MSESSSKILGIIGLVAIGIATFGVGTAVMAGGMAAAGGALGTSTAFLGLTNFQLLAIGASLLSIPRNTPTIDATGATARARPTASPSARGAYVFGTTTVPMTLVYEENHGLGASPERQLTDIFAHCWHRIEAYQTLHVTVQHGREEVTFTGEAADAPYTDMVWWFKADGTQTQSLKDTVSEGLFAFSAWQTTSVFKGVAHSALMWNINTPEFLEQWGNVPSRIEMVVQGAWLYDPRLDPAYGTGTQDFDDPSTWSFNDGNAALVLLRFLIGEFTPGGVKIWGRGAAEADIDMDSFITAANIADEVLDSVPRFKLGGMHELDGSWTNFVGRWEQETGGKLAKIAGVYYCWLPNDDLTPVTTITEDKMLQGVAVSHTLGGDITAFYNMARGRYVSPAEGYNGHPYPDVREETQIADEGERILSQEFSWVQIESIAQRIARIIVRRSRFQRMWTFAIGWEGQGPNYKPFTVHNLNCPETNNVNQLVRIVDRRMGFNGVTVITVQEESTQIYDDTPLLGTSLNADEVDNGADPNTIPGRQIQGIGLKINANADGTANTGESAIHALRSWGADFSTDGFVNWNGVQIYVPRDAGDNRTYAGGGIGTRRALLLFDTGLPGTPRFTSNGQARHTAYVYKDSGNNWFYDNDATSVSFTPIANRDVALGWVSLDGDNVLEGGLFGSPMPLEIAADISAPGTSSIVASVYQRAASPPATPTPDDGEYNFSTQTLTPPTGWSATPPASDGNPLYVSVGIFEITGTTGSDSTVTWTAPALLVSDGVDGVPGAAGADGADGDDARAVNLTAGQQSFAYLTDNTLDPGESANTTVTATALNTVGTVYYEFFENDVSQQNTTTPTYTFTPQAAYGNMPRKIEVQIREGAPTGTVWARDQFTIFGVKPGVDAPLVIQTNEAHTVPVVGGTPDYTGSGNTIRVYLGTTQLTYDASAPFANGSFRVTGAVGSNITVGTPTPGANEIVYGNASAITANVASITYTIVVVNNEGIETTVTRVQSFSRSTDGADGAAGSDGNTSYLGLVYQRSVTQPSTPAVNDGQYNFDTGVLTPPSGWSTTPPDVNGQPLWVSTGLFEINGTSGTDTTVVWTTPTKLVSDGPPGDIIAGAGIRDWTTEPADNGGYLDAIKIWVDYTNNRLHIKPAALTGGPAVTFALELEIFGTTVSSFTDVGSEATWSDQAGALDFSTFSIGTSTGHYGTNGIKWRESTAAGISEDEVYLTLASLTSETLIRLKIRQWTQPASGLSLGNEWVMALTELDALNTTAAEPQYTQIYFKPTQGLVMTWKGSLASAPANPQVNWAYYNTTDNQAYIWDGDSWEVLSVDGTDGTPGTDGNDGASSHGILVNGGFETGSFTPHFIDQGNVITGVLSSNPRTGTYHGYTDGDGSTDPNSVYAFVSSWYPCEEGMEVFLSGYFYRNESDLPNDGIAIRAQYADAAQSPLTFGPASNTASESTSGYQKLQARGVAVAGAEYVRFVCYWTNPGPIALNGQWFYDDLAMNLQTIGASSHGILVNGGFETGEHITGWETVNNQGGAVTTAAAGYGTYGLNIPNGTGGPNHISRFYTAPSSGRRIAVEAWARRSESPTPGSNQSLQVRWYDSSEVFISTTTVAAALSSVSGWQFLTGQATPPANAVFFTVSLGEGTGVGSFDWDDAAAYFVGEPGTAHGSTLNKDPFFQKWETEWFSSTSGAAIDTTAFNLATNQDAPVGNTALNHTASALDFVFSERFPIDPSKLYLVEWAPWQDTVTSNHHIAMQFFDENGDNISNVSTPVSDAIGEWASITANHYILAPSHEFPTGAYTKRSRTVGYGGRQTIPSNAKSAVLLWTANTNAETDDSYLAYYLIREITRTLTDLPAPFGAGRVGGEDDFSIYHNQNLNDPGSNFDAGEFHVVGTTLYHPDGSIRTMAERANWVIQSPMGESKIGKFFIMWSDTDPDTRFAGSYIHANLCPIAYDDEENGWYAFDNSAATKNYFTPLSTDCILGAGVAYDMSGGIDEFVKITGTIKNPESLEKGVVFKETFEGYLDQSAFLLRWQETDTASNAPDVTFPNDGLFGGRVIDIDSDEMWVVHKDIIPFNPETLYKISARWRRTVDGAGSPSIFIGVTGVGADGVTLENTSGADAYGSQHYILVAGESPTVADGWQERSAYFQGVASTGQTFTKDALTALAPLKLHQDVRYIRPTIIANYDNITDAQYQIDYIIIEAVETQPISELVFDPFMSQGFNSGRGWESYTEDGDPVASYDDAVIDLAAGENGGAMELIIPATAGRRTAANNSNKFEVVNNDVLKFRVRSKRTGADTGTNTNGNLYLEIGVKVYNLDTSLEATRIISFQNVSGNAGMPGIMPAVATWYDWEAELSLTTLSPTTDRMYAQVYVALWSSTETGTYAAGEVVIDSLICQRIGNREDYTGFIDAGTLSSSKLPRGWSVSYSAGDYTITHNLGAGSPAEHKMHVTATLFHTSFFRCYVKSQATNSFVIRTETTGGAATNTPDFMFHAKFNRLQT